MIQLIVSQIQVFDVHSSMCIKVSHRNMFLMKKIGSTRSASIWGLLWRNPKGFFISISFRGCTSHSCFEYFYIADFYSALTLPDRDLQSEGWVKKNGLFENTSQVSNLPSPPLSRTEQNKTRPRPIFSRFISYFLADLSFASFSFWPWFRLRLIENLWLTNNKTYRDAC